MVRLVSAPVTAFGNYSSPLDLIEQVAKVAGSLCELIQSVRRVGFLIRILVKVYLDGDDLFVIMFLVNRRGSFQAGRVNIDAIGDGDRVICPGFSPVMMVRRARGHCDFVPIGSNFLVESLAYRTICAH